MAVHGRADNPGICGNLSATQGSRERMRTRDGGHPGYADLMQRYPAIFAGGRAGGQPHPLPSFRSAVTWC